MSDCELTFNCTRQVLKRVDGSVVAADAVKKLYASFMLCPNWDGLTVYARFEHEENGTFDIEIAGGCCIVPWEVISEPSFSVALFGEDGNGARLTSTRVNVAVTRSVDYYSKQPIDPQEPTPSILEQFQQTAAEAKDAAAKADKAAASASDAATKASNAAKKAETAAGRANTEASRANTAYSRATSAANSADAAASAAYSAAGTANSAASSAESAASTAYIAADSASTAASAANTAASTATSAASRAASAAQSAEQTVQGIVDGYGYYAHIPYTENRSRNVLTATAEGELVHVEDAFTSEPREVVVINTYQQDGTPTPDNPIEIKTLSAVDLCVSGADTSVYDTTSITLTDAEGNTVEVCPSLPDGTADELALTDNGDGTASVEHVGVSKLKEITGTESWTMGGGSTYPYFVMELGDGKINVDTAKSNGMCNSYMHDNRLVALMADKTFKTSLFSSDKTGMHLYIRDTDYANLADFKAYLADRYAAGTPIKVLYELNNPVVTDCGTVPIAALPESITNVWASADVPTSIKLTYEQDINIIINQLQQAIVAAAATE